MQRNFTKTIKTLSIASLFFLGLKYLLPKSRILSQKITSKQVVVDSLMLKEIEFQRKIDSVFTAKKNDSIKKNILYRKKIIKDSVKKSRENPFHKIPNINLSKYTTNLQLENFYKKLEALENNKRAKIRIAYYGDSMNDGDLIVQDLRKLFQEIYGGKGVGFVNIYSESAKNRGSISHTFSNDWLHSSFLKRIKSKNLGISGYVAFTDTINNNSWVHYKTGYFPSKNKLYNPTLYYGKPDSDLTTVYIDEKGVQTPVVLDGKNLLNTHTFNTTAVNSLKLFFDTNSTPIYGVDFSSNSGVHIDNYSTRGNSGLGLTLLRYNLTSEFQKKLKYDLIILQFGTNVVSYKNKNYHWYKRGMKRVVKHLNTVFSKADVLVLSVADKSKKYELEMKTDSAVYKLLKSQYYLAKETNSSFISLFELMGGNNSMKTWVEEKPIRARKDYTHFNSNGSKKIAWLIFNEIEKGFKKYKKTKKEIKKNSVQ